MSIEIANESGVDIDESALAGLARHVLDEMRVHPLAELSVLLVDEPAMTELHVRWMGEEGPTDVLAFPMDELRPPQPGGVHAEHAASDPPGVPGLLGDVVICPQVARAQAELVRHGVQGEIDLLCTHGILHLLGYDHADASEHARMFGLQDRLLASWHAESGGPAGYDGLPDEAAGDQLAQGPDLRSADIPARGAADGDPADGREARG